MTQSKSIELVKIANRFGTGITTQSFSDKNTVYVTAIKTGSLFSDEMSSKEEAELNLLAKLQRIVCPDYAQLKQSVEYNRGEVNRLNNVIADRDWTIEQLTRKLEIVESVLKQAQADFTKQIAELQEAFDTAHNTNIYLRKENEKLKQSKSIADKILEMATEVAEQEVCDGENVYPALLLCDLKQIIEAVKAEPQAQSVEADGYVAIYSKQDIEEPTNPDVGYCGTLNTGWQHSFCTSKEGVQNYIFNKYFGVCFEEDSKKDCAALRSLYADGWQIRPVKLLFLDEGKCKKE